MYLADSMESFAWPRRALIFLPAAHHRAGATPDGGGRVRPGAPLDGLTRTEVADPMVLAGALAGAAAAIARLDQALAGHPLAQAFLYRARLDAVRRQAAVDG
jgi:hypothetical protein